MREVKKILCPVDFSDVTENLAAHCRYLAQKLDAEVLVLYVAPSMNRYAEIYVEPGDLQRVVKSIVKGAQEQMDTFITREFQGMKARGEVKIGYAPDAILETIDHQDMDMVVMCTHGRRGINHLIFGSVAEKIVKSSPVPVVTVRPKAKE